MKPQQAFALNPTRLVYVCPLCPNVFGRRSTLKVHLLGVHKVDTTAAGFYLNQASRLSAAEVSQTRSDIHGSRYQKYVTENQPAQSYREG